MPRKPGAIVNHGNNTLQCTRWKRFADSLKAAPTKSKLNWLNAYLYNTNGLNIVCCSDAIRQTQVLDYLYAMANAGLIQPFPDSVVLYETRLGNWRDQIVITDWSSV